MTRRKKAHVWTRSIVRKDPCVTRELSIDKQTFVTIKKNEVDWNVAGWVVTRNLLWPFFAMECTYTKPNRFDKLFTLRWIKVLAERLVLDCQNYTRFRRAFNGYFSVRQNCGRRKKKQQRKPPRPRFMQSEWHSPIEYLLVATLNNQEVRLHSARE